MKRGNKVEANFIQIALILLSILLSLTLTGILLYAYFKKAKNRVLLSLSAGILMHAVTSAAYYTRELWLGILSYALFTTLILHATAKYLKTKGKTPSCELFAFIIPSLQFTSSSSSECSQTTNTYSLTRSSASSVLYSSQ